LELLTKINGIVWGAPTLVLIIGIGGYLTVGSGFAQLRLFPRALKEFLSGFKRKNDSAGVSPYQALCTALAATVGTGNLAGVAGAIALGGPGAVFWMWICGILGMITKFAEVTLSVRYAHGSPTGERMGGPMFIIEKGMGSRWKWMASLYSFFGIIAAFGVGNATQINTVIGGIAQIGTYFSVDITTGWRIIIGIVLAVLIGSILLGGAKKVGEIAEKLVPFASVVYIVLCFGVLFACRRNIAPAVSAIITGAFTPRAVTGGVLGSAFTALRVGASRGVFTNEAGMGTAGIAHASARVQHPVQQGFMGMTEVFLDTLVICTLTAIVILSSPISIVYGEDIGIGLTLSAFSSVYGGWVSILLSCLLICFAIATVVGWGVYGARCAQYLFGEGVWRRFVYIQMVVVVVGALLGTGTVWILADIVNGLMAIPNLIALCVLGSRVFQLLNEYNTHPLH